VTIGDGYLSDQNVSGRGAADRDVTSERWFCFTVFLGAHFDKGIDEPMDSISVSTDHLSWWLREPRPIMNRGSLPQAEGVTLEVPDALIVTLPLGEFSLHWLTSSRRGRVDAEISVSPLMGLRPIDALSITDAWQAVIRPVVLFLTFATGEPNRITSCHVSQGDDPRTCRTARVLLSSWASPTLETTPDWFHFILPFTDVRDRFDDIVRGWFEIYGSGSTAIMEHFTPRLAPHTYLEDSFGRSVRSLELWHRSRIGTPVIPEPEFQALLDVVRSSVTKADWRFLEQRLRYANEPTLKRRLDEMVDRAIPLLSREVRSYRRFTRRVTDMRNALTHGGGDPPVHHMSWALQVLDGIFYNLVLVELGFDVDQIEEIFRRSGLWDRISFVGNVWVAEARGIEIETEV
jgi:hypothetical protein